MKKNLITLICLALGILLLLPASSCRKKAHKIAPEYVGDWRSGGSCCQHLNVKDNSRATWTKSGITGCNSSWKGTLLVGNKSLRLGTFKFAIQEEPMIHRLEPNEQLPYSHDLDVELVWRMKLKCVSVHCHNESAVFYRPYEESL